MITPYQQAGPHDFHRLGRLRKLRHSCSVCYFHKDDHPVKFWVHARPLGDHTPAIKRNR